MRPIDADDLLEIIEKYCGDYDCHDSESFDKQAVRMAIRSAPTLTPQNEPQTIEQLREMKDEPAYLKVFDPLLQSGWHIIKVVTEDKIIFRGWEKVYVPIDCLGVTYNLYRRPPEGEA